MTTTSQFQRQALRDSPAFLDRKQLADRWGCSISTLKRLEKERALQAIRFGKRILRYSRESIEEIEKTR